MSTIFAVSSGRPPAAIAVVRISGPDALLAGRTLAGSLPPARQAAVRLLRDAWGGALDRALVLVFPGPGSATGEDVVELHCHGGRAVIVAIEHAIAALPSCRRAEPGEFTRRALLNGRIDLSEAEGLADLLQAETEAQRVAALQAAEGRVSRQVKLWLAAAAMLSARIEAMLDHADEDDVDSGEAALAALRDDTRALGHAIAEAASGPTVERLRDGIRIVIAGPPNAGKSTLLNLMAERDAAIVSPIAGTTRDRIEAAVAYGGVAYLLSDTAGITETADAIEAEGVSRARGAVATADLVLWLGEEPPPPHPHIWVQARADLPDRIELRPGRDLAVRHDRSSSIAMLWQHVAARSAALLPKADQVPLRERERALCIEAADALGSPDPDPLVLGEQLRQARQALASITGGNATEAMLDSLFSRFCIGK